MPLWMTAWLMRGPASRRVMRRAEDAMHRVEDAATGIERYIEEKPLQSAVMALLAGIVIGLLNRR
jgi:ElaB/YqjD/DUF883 family membrane-anchored ribosome-binding protein